METTINGRAARFTRSLLALFVLSALGFAAQSATADETGRDNVRLNWGKASETDLTTAIWGDYDASPESEYIIAGSWGRRISPTMFGLPIELTGNVGLQWVNSRGLQDDGYGINAYIKAHYSLRLPWTQKDVRFGLGEGVSYLSEIPLAEQRDFAKKGPDITSEKLMNYVEWTVDVPMRQFATMDRLISKDIDDVYVGFFVFHRSSVFGLFAETKGGINFMGFGIEARY
ncbi:hypothetical protein [Povalibacter sp.]|uniref:hypothetical protein n=1 Tax=Povalibacter sp. TaxID=1962978 RepID=UPI002F427E32